MKLRQTTQNTLSLIIFWAVMFLTLPIVAAAQDKIVFTSERNGDNGEIYVMNADGSNQTSLTPDAESFITNGEPSFSLNGSRIAFYSDREPLFGTNFEIFVMNADGSNPMRVTFNAAYDSNPSFSPDGSKIAFDSNRDEAIYSEIYVMNADGTNQTRLTDNPTIDESPSFSQDGSRIAFHSNRDGGNYEIYVMSSDGTKQSRLTNNPRSDWDPSWSR